MPRRGGRARGFGGLFRLFPCLGVSSTEDPSSSTGAPRSSTETGPRLWRTQGSRNGATRCPAASSARRTACACPTASGESPCTHTESTSAASATACSAISTGSASRAPGSPRAISRPSAVAAVGEPLDVRRPAGRRGQRQEQRPREAQHRQVAGSRQHGLGLLGVVGHPVVERAVRLEVAHRRPLAPAIASSVATCSATSSRSTAQGTSRATRPKPARSRVGDLGSDDHPEPGRARADGPDRRGRPGVEAAGHVGRGDHLEQARVVGDLLTQVGVEVDGAGLVSRHPARRA